MSAQAFAYTNMGRLEPRKPSIRRAVLKFQIAGAALGLTGSVLAGISGGALIAASWLSAGEALRHWLSTAGSTLLLLTIPLLLLGACCLDGLGKDELPRQTSTAYDDDDEQ